MQFELTNGEESIKIKFPDTLKDVTLDQWVEFQNEIGHTQPQAMKEFEEAKDHKAQKAILDEVDTDDIFDTWLPYRLSAIQWWGGIDDDVARKIPMESLNATYTILLNILSTFGYDPEQRSFKHNGAEYHFPILHEDPMTKTEEAFNDRKMVDIIESMQFEKYATRLGNSDWSAIPYIVGILCRRKDSEGVLESIPLDAEERKVWIEQRAVMMRSLTMDKALTFAFFFAGAKRHYPKTTQLYLVAKAVEEQVAKAKSLRGSVTTS